MLVAAVGIITLDVPGGKYFTKWDGGCTVVLAERMFQKNPGLVWTWAEDLDTEIMVDNQIGWEFGQRVDDGVSGKRPMVARG
jgi:hypothetical protein